MAQPAAPAARDRRQDGRPGGLWELLLPDLWVETPDAIDLDALARRGIRCLLVDVDNTLVPWGEGRISQPARRFVERAREAGLSLVLLSNARPSRRAWAAAALGIPSAPRGFKPLPASFVKAASMVGCRPHEAAVVGDQIWTDVLGGNLAGMYTILVDPIQQREHSLTRLGRRLERALLSHLARRGRLDPVRVAARLRGPTSRPA